MFDLWLAIEFADTVTIGTIALAAMVSIATVIGILYGVRYKVGFEASAAASDELRKSLADSNLREEHLRESALLVKEQHDALTASLRQQLNKSNETIAKLEAMPDLAQLAALLDAHEVRAQERYESAERRMAERHQAEVDVLVTMAKQIQENSKGGSA
jgi:hypothetical protein